ncbi:MAG: GNAT family N-acetyltransferase [Erythrobacter sp.]|uniref:GNAT family N-acetyltransferase n=1 Tax=Erythrobacter sp. TaxID=1042 RepID=UPI003C76B392
MKRGRNAGNYVFVFRGDTDLAPVNVQQLRSDLNGWFRAWKDRNAVVALVQAKMAEGCQCFAITDDDDKVLCYLLARTGATIDEWFIDLEADDAVLFSVVTHPGARGERLAGRLTASVARRYVANGGRALLDCAVWNVSAHKAFEAAGFELLRPEPFPPLRG